jgi:hypothetical protein
MPPHCDAFDLGFVEEWLAAHPNASRDEFLKDPQAADYTCSELEIFKRVQDKLVKENEKHLAEQHLAKPTWIYEHMTLAVPIESPVQRYLWLLSLLLGPPAFGYAALFYAAPWICRGFKSPRQRNIRVT